MGCRDDVGAGQREKVPVAFERQAVGFETVAPVVGFGEVVRLLHGARGTVEDQNALVQGSGKRDLAVALGFSLARNADGASALRGSYVSVGRHIRSKGAMLRCARVLRRERGRDWP